MRQLLIRLALFRSFAFFIKDSTNAEPGPNLTSSEVNTRLESDPEFALEVARKLKEQIEVFLADAAKTEEVQTEVAPIAPEVPPAVVETPAEVPPQV